MTKIIKTNKHKNDFECFLKKFPILSLIFTILFIIIIWIFSFNDIEFAIWNYQNVKTFTEIYEIPLKLFLVLLTIWGILVAYRTYIQTKDQFIVLNKAWISSKIVFHLIPHQKNIDIKKPVLLFEIENIGNTPAEKFYADININPSNIFNFDIKNQIPKILFPKEAYTFVIEMGTKIFEYKEILESKPFFDINIKINYSTFDNNTLKIDETYKFIYPNQPYVIEKEIIQINKDGKIVKLS